MYSDLPTLTPVIYDYTPYETLCLRKVFGNFFSEAIIFSARWNHTSYFIYERLFVSYPKRARRFHAVADSSSFKRRERKPMMDAPPKRARMTGFVLYKARFLGE